MFSLLGPQREEMEILHARHHSHENDRLTEDEFFLSFPRVAAARGGSCRPERSEGTEFTLEGLRPEGAAPRPFTSFRAAAAAVPILRKNRQPHQLEVTLRLRNAFTPIFAVCWTRLDRLYGATAIFSARHLTQSDCDCI